MFFDKEHCKELKEDNNYVIFDTGELYSKKSKAFLKGKIDNVGYRSYSVTFHNSGLGTYRKYLYAHRLVAEYFIPNPKNLPVVNHIDENRLNNNVNNLEWVSHSDNYRKYRENNWGKSAANRKPTRYIEKNLPGEEWKDVKDHSLYQVSNMGRVRNKRTFKWLRQDECHTYNRVCLMDDSKHKHNVTVHRLVYCTFANDYDLNNYVIDHIDNNPKNNKFSNLQKITQSQNTKKQPRYQK